MAARKNKSDLNSVVNALVAQLQEIIEEQVAAQVSGGEARGRGGRKAKAVAGKGGGRRGPKAGFKAELKPCPICATPNKARRFSYLCEDHRDKESLAKFKGATRGKVIAKPAGRGRKAAARG